MPIVYDKLWHRLAERNMKKQDLREATGISRASIAKLSKNEIVTTEVLFKICVALKCDLADIAEVLFTPHMTQQMQFDTFPEDNIEVEHGPLRINSFFAGIGGFDIGFENQGFVTQYLCEINPFCNAVLTTHWPNVLRSQDICEINPDDIPDAEVWCGGFPCQDISVARGSAKRLGLGGARSGLFYQYARLIEAKEPQVVIIENVEGLFNSNGGRDFGVILQRMTGMGYAVAWRLVNSRYFGVPQSRPRVYLCCWRQSPAKAMRVLFDSQGAHRVENQRKDFLTEASEPDEYPKVPRVAYCLAATSGRHTGTDWSRTYVVCRDGVRRLTPKEYERLQGFPDNWTIPANYQVDDDDLDTLRYTAVGNAVSVPVVEWVASRIRREFQTPDNALYTRDELQSYVPEFSKTAWVNCPFVTLDFMDEGKQYKWPQAGIAYNGAYIGGSIAPTPAELIKSNLLEVVEKGYTNSRYYLGPNAAEGILRRVDNQGRKLFAPLRKALEIESKKAK